MLAYCTHRDAGFGWFSGVSHARAYPPRSVLPSHHSAGYAIPIGQRWVYGCVCTFYISIFFMSFGLDPGEWHHGASRSRHHCPAPVSGLDPGDQHTSDLFSERSPLPRTPDRHARGRGYARRTLALRGAAGRRREWYGWWHNGLR
jgi:hypothetical protein